MTANIDQTNSLRDIVAVHVDQALARRIDDELADLPDISVHSRRQWIAEILARRDGIIEQVTTQVARHADAPTAPSLNTQ
jgi:hypothetical protein